MTETSEFDSGGLVQSREEFDRDVEGLVADVLEIDSEKVSLEDSFVKDLKVDSLDAVNIIIAAEQEYDMDIPDEEAVKIRTVQDLANYAFDNYNVAKKD